MRNQGRSGRHGGMQALLPLSFNMFVFLPRVRARLGKMGLFGFADKLLTRSTVYLDSNGYCPRRRIPRSRPFRKKSVPSQRGSIHRSKKNRVADHRLEGQISSQLIDSRRIGVLSRILMWAPEFCLEASDRAGDGGWSVTGNPLKAWKTKTKDN